MSDLELQRKSLPNEPGIYLFKDKEDKIIYIGKANDLKKRVSSYFIKTTHKDPYYEEKMKELVKRISSIEYIVTENDKEALILENIQIKQHFPRFNVIMRDSKTYPYIAIFYAEEYPRIKIIRGPEKYSSENLFLGPYTDKKEIQRILRDLRKIFPYCTCQKKIKKCERPCIYYQLKLCPGPCIGAISQKDYMENIKNIELFLKGETKELKLSIEQKMKKEAEMQNFERAAFWRDKLQAIENSTENQNVLLDFNANKDIIGYYSFDEYVAIAIIHIREGRILNMSPFELDLKEKLILKEEILPSLIQQYYQDNQKNLPDVIIIPELSQEFGLLKELLNDIRTGLQIRVPSDEKEEALIRIANKNAKVMVEQQIQMEDIKKKQENQINDTLEETKELLTLPTLPRIIEGFDISNIEGNDATGSMVYFFEGKPYNKNYRHYNIRFTSTPDDIAMIKEVINRRYTFLLESEGELPDMILVDGGKGQVNAAISVLKELSIDNIPVIGLAKKFEEIYIPNEKEPITLPENSSTLKLFQNVRDEAHRFAKKLHKKQRQKKITKSKLDDIKGIGPATKSKLLKHFGSVEGIKKASVEEIRKIIGKKKAELLRKNVI